MFNWVESEAGIELTMAATLENIDQADERLAAFIDRHKVPVDGFAIRILLRESLLNAVTHGSGLKAERAVRMYCTKEPSQLVLRVEDEGAGFDWRAQGHEFDVMGDGGRGVAIMHMYSDDITFNESGNCITLRRRFTDVQDKTGSTAKLAVSGESS